MAKYNGLSEVQFFQHWRKSWISLPLISIAGHHTYSRCFQHVKTILNLS